MCVPLNQIQADAFDHDANCDKLTVVSTSSSLNQQRLNCRKCKPRSVNTTQFITYNEFCYPLVPEIPNCISYDAPAPLADILATQLQLIETNDFRCTQCSSVVTYYLDRVLNTCVTRTVIPSCTTYDEFADRCKVCAQGFILTVDMKTCWNFKNNKTPGYLDACRDIEECRNTTQYEGLDHVLNTIYSCHRCNSVDNIPFSIGTLVLNELTPGLETFVNINEVDN